MISKKTQRISVRILTRQQLMKIQVGLWRLKVLKGWGHIFSKIFLSRASRRDIGNEIDNSLEQYMHCLLTLLSVLLKLQPLFHQLMLTISIIHIANCLYIKFVPGTMKLRAINHPKQVTWYSILYCQFVNFRINFVSICTFHHSNFKWKINSRNLQLE